MPECGGRIWVNNQWIGRQLGTVIEWRDVWFFWCLGTGPLLSTSFSPALRRHIVQVLDTQQINVLNVALWPWYDLNNVLEEVHCIFRKYIHSMGLMILNVFCTIDMHMVYVSGHAIVLASLAL